MKNVKGKYMNQSKGTNKKNSESMDQERQGESSKKGSGHAPSSTSGNKQGANRKENESSRGNR